LNLKEQLKEKIKNKTAIVAVFGLGYVGLPLAVEKAKVGFNVIGIDRNTKRVEQINQGKNYIRDVSDEELAMLVSSGKIKAYSDTQPEVLKEADIVVMCVPTPLTKNMDPDISYIENVTDISATQLRRGQLITLESTTYPGTTEDIVLPRLAKGGLRVGEDFFLAYSPERVDPGNQRYTTKNTSKVLGGVTPDCMDVALSFYAQTINQVVPVSCPAAAELTKVFENTYRSVNIALVNELAIICDKMGINVWEVLDAAATKPFGIQIFYPGPGVGGHCIPIDPFYLTWKAREYDFHTRFIELAGEINMNMPYFIISRLSKILNEQKKCINGSKILVLGAAYKKNVDDARESPAVKIIELLLEKKADVSYHDPYIDQINAGNNHLFSADLTEDNLKEAACVLITTDHSNVDYQFVVKHSSLIFDTRNATRGIKEDHIIRL